MKQSRTIPIIKIIITIGLAVGIISLYLLFSIDTPTKPISGNGNMVKENVQIGGDFILIDQDGKTFNSASLKGKLSLIYFGFTYCPDICPTTLQKLAEVLKTLDKYKIDVTPVFITIDPERDNIRVLKEYLAHFHNKIIGLTGSAAKIKEAADKFKVYYARADTQNHRTNEYMIDHSSFIYLMDKNGKYMKHFYMNASPQEIIEFIRINK